MASVCKTFDASFLQGRSFGSFFCQGKRGGKGSLFRRHVPGRFPFSLDQFPAEACICWGLQRILKKQPIVSLLKVLLSPARFFHRFSHNRQARGSSRHFLAAGLRQTCYPFYGITFLSSEAGELFTVAANSVESAGHELVREFPESHKMKSVVLNRLCVFRKGKMWYL